MAQVISVSGGIRPQDQLINKVSVIGGGDLGMASVMSILAKVNPNFFYMSELRLCI